MMNKRAFLWVLIALVLLSGCQQIETPKIKQVPFTSQSWSIQGVAPEGWMEVNPGHFAGDEWPINQLLHEVYPGMTEEIAVATVILPRLGIDALPEPVGKFESGEFTWDLYTVDIEDPVAGQIVVDLAMAETNTGAYMVALVTGVDDHDPLRQAVFIPAIEALEVIEVNQRDRITLDELQSSDYAGDGPVNYAYFSHIGDPGSADHELEGTLTVPEFKMFDTVPDDRVLQSSLGYFPGFSAEFFTYAEHLVPVQREVILSSGEKSFWKIIFSQEKCGQNPETAACPGLPSPLF
jgi:hypothetical protein